MSQTLSKKNWLEPVREAGGVLERRRGGVSSSYWNNYWTAPSQPNPPLWHIQQCTVAALIKGHQLIVTARRRGMPSRCAIPSALSKYKTQPDPYAGTGLPPGVILDG